MVEANPKSYKQRMRKARAAARAQGTAEKAARQREIELVVEVKRLAREPVTLTEIARSYNVSHMKIAGNWPCRDFRDNRR
jgi:hypothetical protein